MVPLLLYYRWNIEIFGWNLIPSLTDWVLCIDVHGLTSHSHSCSAHAGILALWFSSLSPFTWPFRKWKGSDSTDMVIEISINRVGTQMYIYMEQIFLFVFPILVSFWPTGLLNICSSWIISFKKDRVSDYFLWVSSLSCTSLLLGTCWLRKLPYWHASQCLQLKFSMRQASQEFCFVP